MTKNIPPEDDVNIEDTRVVDALDTQILMHRDIHFGGKFEMMLEYYTLGGKGVCIDFDIKRIEHLMNLEKELKQDLAGILLSGPEAEKVAEAKLAYEQLRKIYETKNLKYKHPELIADLILTEEENPEMEINAVIAEKATIVPELIKLLRSDEYHDPLYPGYGQAPILAATCLGRIGDKRAIISLFEEIGQNDVFSEEFILKALQAIGQPAKEFLLKVVRGKPINDDNARAATALIAFKDDPDVAETCFKLLQDPKVKDHPFLGAYLVLACDGIAKTPYLEDFKAMAEDKSYSPMIRQDIKALIKSW